MKVGIKSLAVNRMGRRGGGVKSIVRTLNNFKRTGFIVRCENWHWYELGFLVTCKRINSMVTRMVKHLVALALVL